MYKFQKCATFRLGYNVPTSLQLVEHNHSLILLILAAHVPVSKMLLLFVSDIMFQYLYNKLNIIIV